MDTMTDVAPTRAGAFERNLAAMTALLADGAKPHGGKSIGFELERILIDADGAPVPYSGPTGAAALLAELARGRDERELVHIDGNLMGLAFAVDVDGEPVEVTISLEPASQLEVSAGPARTVRALYRAVEAVDAQIASALAAIGSRARLVARGYDPAISHPLELELIPKERYRDMDAYLSRHGRYARDMMRATASTQVSLDYEDEDDARRVARMATFLGPVLAFLFDNAPTFRGRPSPGMARSRIWHHVDTERCGIAPGSLGGFSFDEYARWVSGVRPILFTDEAHVTRATGDLRARDVMDGRDLARPELFHLLSMVFPNVRLKGFCELREMDALPPRLAAACTSLVGALLYDEGLEGKLAHALRAWLPKGFEGLDEEDCAQARFQLEERGWEAAPYGVPVTEIARALTRIARATVESGHGAAAEGGEGVPVVLERDAEAVRFDVEGIDLLARMWEARELPRDGAEDWI